jgi:DNA-directed RNA polymerase subunit alpha
MSQQCRATKSEFYRQVFADPRSYCFQLYGQHSLFSKSITMIDITSAATVTLMVAAETYARFAIAPLDHGYGITLGNALRRVLLSSIPGAAVTRIKIEGVYHEFAPIPNVREDVTDLVLAIKGIRLRSYVERPVKVLLTRQSAGVVCARDIDAPSTVEIANPEHYLCTLDIDAPLAIELSIERGRDALLAEMQQPGPIGEIAIDAIFSPITKVNVVVEPLDDLNPEGNERLILEIWTDGTLKPGDALSHAATILAHYFQAIEDGLHPSAPIQEVIAAPEGIPADAYATPIDALDLTTRTYNALKRSDILTVGQLLELDAQQLIAVRNMGQKSVEEILTQLRSHGYQRDNTET